MNWTEDQKKAYQQAVLDQALKYEKLGLAVFPLEFASKRPFFDKLPLIEEKGEKKHTWEPLADKRPDAEQMKQWFSADLNNIAVIQGAVSGNLVVLDFDEEPVGIQLAEYIMGETLKNLGAKTIVVKTKKGAHVYLRTDAPVEYEKFDNLTPAIKMEIRADVHYVVAPPSIHPDSGQPYTFVGIDEQIMVIRTEQYKKWRMDLDKKLEEWPYVREILPYWKAPVSGKPETGGRQNLCLGVAAFFRKILEWPQERAEQIIRGICLVTEDEEDRQRINAVQSTYHKEDLDTVGTQKWLGEDLFTVLKAIPRSEKKVEKKKRAQKREEEKEEKEKKRTALREFGDYLYRQVHDEGKDMFARYNRKTGEVTYVDRIQETEEYPVDKQKAGMGVTFPRRLVRYGTPAQLYERLKKRITYASSQTGHKNAIFALYLMYHGCLPPFKRKNLQLIPLGPAGTGKGRYAELALFLGDRARATTDIKTATAYRMNELLNGGLLILDEMPDEDEDLDRFVRGRYDPTSVQERILDASSKTEIAGFKIAGPTIVTRRRGFLDDANADRGIILKCEKPKGTIPLELLDRSEDYDLQDMLAMFWSEHFGDENLLPTEEDLMYDPKLDTVDCRLMLAARYLMKLAKVINSEAEQDLQGFVAEQEILRKELKLTTAEGMVIRSIYEIIQQTMDGHTYIYESKDGHTKKVEDTLAVDYRKGKAVLSLTRVRLDATEDETKTRQVPISWTMISNRAGLGKEDISKLVQPYGVTQEQVGDKNARIRTIAIKVDELDIAFRTFLMDYDPKWKDRMLLAEPQLLESYTAQPPPSEPNVDTERGKFEKLLKAEKASVPSVAPIQKEPKNVSEGDGGELVKAEKVEVSEKSKEISIQAREKIDAALQALQARASPSKFEHEFEILKWAIRFINEQRKAGNKVAAFHLRREGRDQFPKFEESLYRIIDSFFVDIESVAKLIYEARN